MRGKFIKIERPKGYINIDEVYEQLDSVEKEEDCEYGDFGEVLSKWATCDYGEVLEAISCCDVVKAISLDKVKQAREYIGQLKHKNADVEGYRWWNNAIENCLHELDSLIAESEG